MAPCSQRSTDNAGERGRGGEASVAQRSGDIEHSCVSHEVTWADPATTPVGNEWHKWGGIIHISRAIVPSVGDISHTKPCVRTSRSPGTTVSDSCPDSSQLEERRREEIGPCALDGAPNSEAPLVPTSCHNRPGRPFMLAMFVPLSNTTSIQRRVVLPSRALTIPRATTALMFPQPGLGGLGDRCD